MRPLRSALVACLLLATANAQELRFEAGRSATERWVRAELLATQGIHSSLGYSHARITLENLTGSERKTELTLLTPWNGDGFRATRAITLPPGGTHTFFTPIPGAVSYLEARLVVDGYTADTRHTLNLQPDEARGLIVSDDPELRSRWIAEYEARIKDTGSRASTTPSLLGRDRGTLPAAWQLLSAIPIVVADARTALSGDQHAALADYARAGGLLVLLHATQAPAGPLRDLLDDERGRARFGAVVAVADNGLATASRIRSDLVAKLRANLAEEKTNGGQFLNMPQSAANAQAIPGLGAVPVRVFLLAVLAFVGFIVVKTYYWAHRRRQPLMLLVTIPASGFTLAIVVILYGMFAEGFGIQGVRSSLMKLDQASQRAVVATRASLYAGVGPSWILPNAATGLFSRQLTNRQWNSRESHRLEFDLDRQRINGAALPSRTPTHFLTVTPAPARDRLRFQKDGDGWRWLAAAEFAPADADGAILWCDEEGKYWQSRRDGRMEQLASSAAAQRLADAWREAFAGSDPQSRSLLHGWIQEQTANLPPPGTYFARMRSSTALDPLGLEVHWHNDQVFVHGTLGKEDHGR